MKVKMENFEEVLKATADAHYRILGANQYSVPVKEKIKHANAINNNCQQPFVGQELNTFGTSRLKWNIKPLFS